jgi:hypothetical protein
MTTWVLVGLLILFACVVVWSSFLVRQARQSWAFMQVVQGMDPTDFDNTKWCETLPKNVCAALPDYCRWDRSDPSDIQCRNR